LHFDVAVVVIPTSDDVGEMLLSDSASRATTWTRISLGKAAMSKTRKPAANAVADNTAPQQLEAFCFKPGQSGNPKGRPKGARNRLGTAFLEALEGDFNQFGPQAIAQVREKKPEVYMRVVADLLPKEASINVEASEAFVNLWRRISDGLGEELADSLDEEQEQPAPVRH
jgi:hypothetical protein